MRKSNPSPPKTINFLSLSSSSNRCLQRFQQEIPTSFARSKCCCRTTIFLSPPSPSSPPFSGSFFSESWLAASGSFFTGLPPSSVFTSLSSSPSSFLLLSSCLSRSSSFSPASTSVSCLEVKNNYKTGFRWGILIETINLFQYHLLTLTFGLRKMAGT